MSTYFDIACLDCKTESREPYGREFKDDVALQAVIDHASKLLEFLDAVDDNGMLEVDLRISGSYVQLDWLKKHRGHRLAVRCEYENFEELEKRLATGKRWWDYRRAE